MSTLWGMTRIRPPRQNRKIIGISIPPEVAAAVKTEAAKRNISLRSLFEEMWTDYNAKKLR